MMCMAHDTAIRAMIWTLPAWEEVISAKEAEAGQYSSSSAAAQPEPTVATHTTPYPAAWFWAPRCFGPVAV